LRVIVTGGCGFLGAAVVRALFDRGALVLNIDRRRKSAIIPALEGLAGDPGHIRLEANVTDRSMMRGVFREFGPDKVVHLVGAAEEDPEALYESEVGAALSVLEACRGLLARYDDARRDGFRIVTAAAAARPDDGEGDLAPQDAARRVRTALLHNWSRSFGLPLIEGVADEVFGPAQPAGTPIGRVLAGVLSGEPTVLPAAGETVRDYVPVSDFAAGLVLALGSPRPQARYEFSAGVERRDIDVAEAVCALLDERAPRPDGRSWAASLAVEGDPPRFAAPPALDPTAAERVLGWRGGGFHDGLAQLVGWALARHVPRKDVPPPEAHAAE
jgi:dTDP-glucose 4,6-dehydratase